MSIWQTDYGKPAFGELTMANRHVANWYMAKRRIPSDASDFLIWCYIMTLDQI